LFVIFTPKVVVDCNLRNRLQPQVLVPLAVHVTVPMASDRKLFAQQRVRALYQQGDTADGETETQHPIAELSCYGGPWQIGNNRPA
jgi:hypothetical protein